MSTHNRYEITLRHLLMAEAECWLADVFTSPATFDTQALDEYVDVLSRFTNEIYGDVLPRFRQEMNNIVERQTKRSCTCPEGRIDAACPHHGSGE